MLLLFWNGTSTTVDIEYTEVVGFTLELSKTVPLTVKLYKTATATVELNKIVSLTTYGELEDNS
jgi:hypothetical protein